MRVARPAPGSTPRTTVTTWPAVPGAELWRMRGLARPWALHLDRFALLRLDGAGADGQALWHHRRTWYPVGPLSTLFSEPHDVHVLAPRTGPVDVHLLLVGPEVATEVLGGLRPSFGRGAVVDPRIERAFRAACRAPASWPGFARLLALALVRAGARPNAPFASGCEQAVARARSFVEQARECRITLDEVAAAAGLTKFHLERAFAAKVGVPIGGFARLVRGARALVRLRAGERPVDVAHATGFADQAHMTRTFRDLYGFTPDAYRRAFAPSAAAIVA